MSGSRILLVLLFVLHISEPNRLRFEGGVSRCEGNLEVQGQGLNWTGVNPYNADLKFANRVCVELDCGSAFFLRAKSKRKEKKWFIKPYCKETSLDDCLYEQSFTTSDDLYLMCSDSVRLLRGPSLCSGSLELRSDQSWTSVCEGDFDLQDAVVVCRELGCGAPSLLQGALYGEGRAPLRQTFQCEGHESALMDCPRSSSGDTCSSGTAVELTCSEPIRLMGKASHCAGTLEVRHRGEWRPVFVFRDWDLNATAAVCRDLDCGPAVSGKIRKNFPVRPGWSTTDDCMKEASYLRDCVRGMGASGILGVDVVCSGSAQKKGPKEKDSERETLFPKKDKPKQTDLGLLLLLLLLVPLVLVLILFLLIFNRKRSSNVKRRPEDLQRTSPEDLQRTSPEDLQRTSPEDLQRTSPEDLQRTSPEDLQRTSPEDLQRTSPEDLQRTSPEVHMYENLSLDLGPVESTYQSLSPDTRDPNQVYSQLLPRHFGPVEPYYQSLSPDTRDPNQVYSQLQPQDSGPVESYC